MVEQFALGIIAGSLAVATPHIVGASTPSFASAIFAAICYVGAALQLLGFFGVMQERSTLFRRYTTLHLLATLAAFSVAAVWIIMSATRHSDAQSQCIEDFFTSTNSDSSAEGRILCNIFPWVDVGVMAGLWILLAIVQLYLYFVLLSYATGQERDHAKYDSLNDMTKPLANDIPMNNRAEAWDRPAADVGDARQYHNRSDSVASVSTVLGDRIQRPASYGHGTYPPLPGNAHVPNEVPTPNGRDSYYDNNGYNGGMGYPQPTQAHPGEFHEFRA